MFGDERRVEVIPVVPAEVILDQPQPADHHARQEEENHLAKHSPTSARKDHYMPLMFCDCLLHSTILAINN